MRTARFSAYTRRIIVAGTLVAMPAGVAYAQVRIVQTNSGGDNIHLIDPATNTVVGEIKGVPVNHGAAAAPDGKRFYFSSEAERTLDIVDGKTLQVTKKIPLSGRPNNITISKDGRRVYVGIITAPSEARSVPVARRRVKSIPPGRHPQHHVTPDGKRVAGSVAGKLATVIDQATEEPLWTVLDAGVGRSPSRPIRTARPSASSCSSPISTGSRSSTSHSGGSGPRRAAE
jgi:YVTN family beta-propeller protein